MVDRLFRTTLRNFSTLFLIAAVVTVPLHLIFSLVYKNVVETRELHDVIETFPEARQVRGVGKAKLTQSRIAMALITLIELLSIPFLVRAARRALELDRAGETPTVSESLQAMREGGPWWPGLTRAGPVLVALAVGLVFGWLLERSGLLLLEFVSDVRSFAFYGLLQGVTRAAAAPFVLVALAETSAPGREEVPGLY